MRLRRLLVTTGGLVVAPNDEGGLREERKTGSAEEGPASGASDERALDCAGG